MPRGRLERSECEGDTKVGLSGGEGRKEKKPCRRRCGMNEYSDHGGVIICVCYIDYHIIFLFGHFLEKFQSHFLSRVYIFIYISRIQEGEGVTLGSLKPTLM